MMSKTDTGFLINTDPGGAPIGYNMAPLFPQPTYFPGDSGYVYLNRNTLIGYEAPVDSIMAVLNPNFQHLLLTDNKFGHKFRFTGITGGYYDPSDGNYYTKTGVVSTRNAEFLKGGDIYIIDHYQNLGICDDKIFYNINPEDAIPIVLGLTKCGYSDWRCVGYEEVLSMIGARNTATYEALGYPPFSPAGTNITICTVCPGDTSRIYEISGGGLVRAFSRIFGTAVPLMVRTHYKNI
jgi:hypothetical protein